jgi:O-antigen ligase
MLMCFFIAAISLRLQLRTYAPRTHESILLLFFFWYCFSAFMTQDQLYGLRMVFGILIFIFCFAISISYLGKYSFAKLEKCLYIAFAFFNITSLTAFIIGLIYREFQQILTPNQILFGLMHDRGMPRMIGILTNPDYFYLSALITFFFFLYRSDEGKGTFLLAAIAALNIMLTLSIGAALAMIVGVVFAVLTDFRNNIRRFLKLTLLGVPIILFLAVSGFAEEILSKRLLHLNTGSGRWAVWDTAIQTFMANPILGIGAYGFREISLKLHETMNAHNTFLEILVESGTVGIAFFCIGNAVLLFTLARTSKYMPSAKFLIPSVVTMWISMLSVSATIYPAYLFLLIVASRYLLEFRQNYKYSTHAQILI